jgi:hypothetical protein
MGETSPNLVTLVARQPSWIPYEYAHCKSLKYHLQENLKLVRFLQYDRLRKDGSLLSC